MDIKSTGTTMLLNFLVPGIGHVYADGRWGLLIMNVGVGMTGGLLTVCAQTADVLIVTLPVNLVCWIVGMVTSRSVTEKHNDRILGAVADEERWRSEQERTRRSRENAEALARDAEIKAADERDAARVTGAALAQKFAMLHSLGEAGTLSADELVVEKRKLVARSASGWTDEDLADFLVPFAELARQSLITSEDVATAKSLFVSLERRAQSAPAGHR